MGVNVLTCDNNAQIYNLSDWNRRQLNKKLVEDYPFLLPRILSTDTISDDYDYQYTLFDDIPSGWREDFGVEMCEEMKKVLEKYNMLKNYRIFQIKEKFGELRIYGNWGNEEFDAVIKKYTDYSKTICYRCGNMATHFDLLWRLCPVCSNCIDELQKSFETVDNAEFIPFTFFNEGIKAGKGAKQIYEEYRKLYSK